MQHQIDINGLSAVFHMPHALKSRHAASGEEEDQGLPPFAPQPCYPVEEYPGCPGNWEHGSQLAKSVFVRVEPEKGMWLDFNPCFNHTHDVAIVVSIQGINPLTGQKTDAMRLEQYGEKCPVHNVPFHADRFCPSCKYKWPAQNFLSTRSTPQGRLWIDGFRAADGVVRQYVFTEDTAKGVAAKKLGDDRVFAIGVAFFRSKVPKPTWQDRLQEMLDKNMSHTKMSQWYLHNPNHYCPPTVTHEVSPYPQVFSSTHDGSRDFLRRIDHSTQSDEVHNSSSVSLNSVSPVKNLEVKAGARIRQTVYADTTDLSLWEETPYGMLYINYADPETFSRIMAVGRSIETSEGFLAECSTGH